MFASTHIAQHLQGLLRRAVSEGGVLSSLGECAPHQSHFFWTLLVNVGVTSQNQRLGTGVHRGKVTACKVQVLGVVGFPVKAKPFYGVDDRIDVFLFFFFWVGVVKA